ncbi:MAG TPA: PilZ domain-containing protein [Polyangiales bacterium]|nr:PilZ domain-containing protein [Polyangiales bacterium]
MQRQSSATTAIDPAGDPRSTAVRRATPRATLRVRCGCATEQEFVQRYAADICARGMFLRTGRQLPLGARVRFELVLQSGRCALGGVGRVAWLRAADPALGRVAGAGVAFERLRRGDRAVIERMDLARGNAPSRFEAPEERLGRGTADAAGLRGPRGAQLGKLLFEDLGSRSESEPGVSAFLSADLSSELGDGGWLYGGRQGRPGSAEVVADLAEQLEPGAELRESDEAAGEQGDDGARVDLDVELSALRPSEAPVAHSTVRPAPLPIAAVSLRTVPSAVPANGVRPTTTAPALRARIQALRAAESAAPAAAAVAAAVTPSVAADERAALVPTSEAPAPSESLAASEAGSTGVVAASATATSIAPAASAPPDAPAPARARAKGPRSARRSAPVDRDASSAASEHAAVSVALARAVVELAGSPAPSASPAPAQAMTPVPARAQVAEAPPPLLAASPGEAALAPSAAQARKRGASTWPLVIALSAVIVLACGVTYLALSDQLPRVLAQLGLG